MAIAAVAGLATLGGAALGGLVTGFAVGLGYFALGAGMSILSRALAPKPDLGARLQGITQTTREPASSRKIIYGRMRVGGQVVFLSHSGNDNKYLHMAIVFASHEIQAYDEIWFNDNKVWDATNGFDSDWGTYVTIDRKFGTAGQAASTDLVNANVLWTTDHKLSGIAYIAFRLEWNQDKFPQGVPNITAVIRGKKVYDPRDQSIGYSQNPALCIRDYMLDQTYGLGEVAANIDDASVRVAADLCEEQITLDGGGAQDRYQCNGVIDTDNQIKANIEQLLSSMGGRLTYSGGKYFVDGAEYRSPTVTFTEADIVSEIQTQTKQSRRGIYNGVKGIFVSEEKNFKVLDYPAQIAKTTAGDFVTGTTYKILFVGTTDFTAIGASSNNVGVEFTATGAGSGTGTASKSIVEDGAQINLDMPLPFVTNNIQAQRLAKIALLKSRQQVVMTMTTTLKGLRVKVGDTVQVSNDRLNYSSKVFEVVDYSLAITDGALGVNLSCIETSSALYDWNTSDEEDFLSGGELDLYDGRTVDNVTSLAKSEIGLLGPDGSVSTTVELTWTAPDDAFIDFYKIRYNKNGTTDYFHAETKEPRILLSGLDVNSNYDFRVQVQNLLGVTSTGTTLSNQQLDGDTTAPSPVTNVEITSGLKNLTVQWTNPTDADLAYVQIYVASSITKPASPVAQINGTEFVYPAASGEGKGTIKYFWLEAVDFSGNVSTTVGPEYESIQIPKSEEIDGAVSEGITFGIYNALSTTLGTSLTTFGSFSTPAPESDVKKRASLMAMMGITASSPSSDFTVGVRVERKSKGETTGTSLGTVVGNGGVAFGARYIEVAGNVMAELDMYGGIATSATSPGAVYNVVSVEYQAGTDRTRIIYSSNTVISSGDIYYNADKWTSSGTWLTYAPFTEPRYGILGITALTNHLIFQPLAASGAQEDYRIRAKYYGLSSGSASMSVGIAGQIQFLR
jgi:hypothetical protein